MVQTILKSIPLALLCIAFSLSKICAATTDSNAKIVIVGAGASGIAAAVKLFDYGFKDVTILEAESRIGGRIHTIPFADNVIDLGAQWCHGETNNVVYEMVKQRDMLGSSMGIHENTTFHRSNGEKIPDDIIDRLKDVMENIMSKRFNESETLSKSVYQFMKEEFYEAMKKPEFKDIINEDIQAEFLDYYVKEECSAEGSDDLFDTPMRGDFEYSDGNQALNWKDKGYKEFLRILMREHELGKEYGVLHDRIRLSKKVKTITWKRVDHRIGILCQDDGDEILADHVIMTVSLGVLKEQQSVLFDPSLPNEKQKAIEAMGFGTVNKIFLEFDEIFWPNNWTGFSLLWTNDDLKGIRGAANFWWEGVFGIFSVDSQPRVFEVWIIGPFARHMETLSENVIKADCVTLMKRFLKWKIPEPINVIRSTWNSNSNFRGSWSYRSMKMLNSGINSSELSNPLIAPVSDCSTNDDVGGMANDCERPVLQFAGEATNRIHFSTVHGAVESGWREAKRLAEFYKIYIKKN